MKILLFFIVNLSDAVKISFNAIKCQDITANLLSHISYLLQESENAFLTHHVSVQTPNSRTTKIHEENY
jgi:hypothetical protein